MYGQVLHGALATPGTLAFSIQCTLLKKFFVCVTEAFGQGQIFLF